MKNIDTMVANFVDALEYDRLTNLAENLGIENDNDIWLSATFRNDVTEKLLKVLDPTNKTDIVPIPQELRDEAMLLMNKLEVFMEEHRIGLRMEHIKHLGASINALSGLIEL